MEDNLARYVPTEILQRPRTGQRKGTLADLLKFLDARRQIIEAATAILVFLLVWEGILALGYISPYFLAPPSAIAKKFVDLFFVSKEIYPHLAVSAQEGLFGFGLALIVGIPAGIIMGRVPDVRNAFEPFVMALYSTPMIALLPLFIMWLGIGLWSKVVMIFMGGVFAILINTQAGVENADPRVIETARSFTATERQILTKIVFPSALPFILAGVRIAIGRILVYIVVAEMFAASKGLGYMIMMAGSLFETHKLFVGVAILAGLGIVLTQVLRVIEKRVAPWLYVREEG